MGGQVVLVYLCAAAQEGDQERDPDAAANRPHHVEEPGGSAHLLLRDRSQAQGRQRNKDQT